MKGVKILSLIHGRWIELPKNFKVYCIYFTRKFNVRQCVIIDTTVEQNTEDLVTVWDCTLKFGLLTRDSGGWGREVMDPRPIRCHFPTVLPSSSVTQYSKPFVYFSVRGSG